MFNFNYINAQTNTLPPSGNVGIGTMTPNASLEVVGSTSLAGKVTIDSAVTVRDSATFQKKLTVNQDLKIKGSSVFVDNANFKSELKVLGVAKMKDKLVIEGLTQMKGDANVFGNFKIKSLADSTFSTDRWLTIKPNGKVTSLSKSGLLNAIYEPLPQCPVDKNGLFVPTWSAKGLTPTLGAIFTGVNCPAWIGIGTDNPTASLDVRGKGFFASDLQVVANASKMVIGAASSADLGHGTSYLGFNAQRFGSTTGIWQTSSDGPHNGGAVIYGDIFGSLRFATLPYTNTPNQGQNAVPDATVAENTRLFIHRDGNVGIGTQAPQAKLDVLGSTRFIGKMGIGTNPSPDDIQMLVQTETDNEVGICIVPRNTSNQWGVKVITNNSLHKAFVVSNTNNEDIFRIYGNGNIAIQTDKNQSLKTLLISDYNTGDDVFRVMSNGNVFATRVRVLEIGNFPDYVFEPTYNLMPINQLAAYIAANKHLPNMPTAEVVEKEGADLGEINRLLVEKVEELTLYIIELNKRMEQLEADKK